MPEALQVAALGMVSCLGTGAAFNAAAMRCRFDGFIKIDSHSLDHENLLVAKTDLGDDVRGNQRIVQMLLGALSEAAAALPAKARAPLYLCLTQDNPLWRDNRALAELLLAQIEETPWGEQIDREASRLICKGRVGFVRAAQRAQALLEAGRHSHILIAAAESLLQTQILNHYQSHNRLLRDDNPDAFIPGEAAVALLLSARTTGETTEILGLSMAEEPGPIDGDKPLTGDGLTQAVNEAATQAHIPVAETDFRLSTASGESYFFRELSIVHGRTLEDPRQDHPLWHPADHIGEVGAAAAPAMVLMAHYAFQHRYAPGPQALCQLSNDDTQRGAFILRHRSPEHGS